MDTLGLGILVDTYAKEVLDVSLVLQDKIIRESRDQIINGFIIFGKENTVLSINDK